MKKWFLVSFLLALSFNQSAAAPWCNFFNHPFIGYACQLHDATITQENEVLTLNTDNHLTGRSDNDVVALIVGNSTLEFFPNSLLQQFPSIRNLNLDRSGLRVLSPGAFAGCANIIILQLRNNFIENIPAGLFTDCNLFVLALTNNRISEIDDDAFVGQESLIELELQENQLTRISANVFRNLNELEELRLHSNQIAEIEDGAFSGLRNLITFYLRNNQITEIRAEMFDDEISLVFFNLNDNLLTSVPQLPPRAPRLKYIFLNKNQIAEINVGDFSFAYSNITNIELAENRLTTLSAAPFEHLERLDSLVVSYNPIRAVDHELFDRIPSLYTFYMLGSDCADVRFNNIRSVNQQRLIEESLDRCYYHFFEPVITQTCDFIEDGFGYTCVLSNVTFRNFRDKFSIDGMHIREMVNEDITGVRITNSDLARIPPSLFSIFPNVVNFAVTDSGLTRIERETFEECGLVRILDLSRNRIRRLSSSSFENCYFVDQLILDDNQIAEIQPCNPFLLNIYQTRFLSMRRNICVDRTFRGPGDDWLINDAQQYVYRFLNRCFSLWFMFQDQPGPPPPPIYPPPPPPGTTTTAVPLGEL